MSRQDQAQPDTGPNPSSVCAKPSFAQVYDEHFGFVWRTARHLGIAPEDMDDCVQDVFLAVHRRLGDFEGRSSIQTWLFGISLMVVRNHRRRSRRKGGLAELPEELPDSWSQSPETHAQKLQAVRLVHHLLDQLEDGERELVVMADLQGMTVPEISEILGCNVNTIYSRLRVAREKFERAVARFQARSRRGERD